MTLPVFLQFLSTCYKWIRLEKRENKRWSWILLLLQFWPQWRAIRVINLSYKDDGKAERKKQELLREVTSTEPFLEAWPSIIIMTMIWVPFLGENPENSGVIEPPQEFCTSNPNANQCAVFSGTGGATWFFITFSISVFTGCLGITKSLKTGPFSILSEKGPLGGILTWKFILAFQAVMFSILTKGIFMAIMMGQNWNYDFEETFETTNRTTTTRPNRSTTTTMTVVMLILLGTVILPNFVYGLISMASSTGLNKKLFQVIISYPASLVLPIATYFTIGPINSRCGCENKQRKRHLGFSKCSSIINMVLTVIMYVIVIASFASDCKSCQKLQKPYYHRFHILLLTTFSPVMLIGLVFNIVYLTLDKSFCFSGSQECYCAECCGPSCFITKEQIIDLEKDDMLIVQIKGNG